jgi:hypothetical protein
LQVGFSPAQLDAAVSALVAIGDIGGYLNKLALVLEFDSSSEIPKLFASMIQTVIFAASRTTSEFSHNRFAGRLLSAQNQADFAAIVSEIWPADPPLKAAQIVWNCFVMSQNRPGLTLFDLNLAHVALPDWYIFRLPETFTDFFSEECGGDEILQLASQRSVLRCLTCGKALTPRPGPASMLGHAVVCGKMVLVILGDEAPQVFWCIPSHARAIPLNPLYVNAQGDDDIGLRAGNPLVLSRERRSKLIRGILSGDFDGLQ